MIESKTPIKSRSRKLAPAPFSAAAANLIKQLQTEARDQLLNELGAKDAIIVLHGFDAATKRVRVGGNHFTVRDCNGNYVSMHRHHVEPEAWRGLDHMQGYWHPAHWFGSMNLVDASGAMWSREIKNHVCDDFGNLVEVAA